MAILILMWLAASFFIGYVAKEKNRSYGAWLGLSILFSPLLALLALIALPIGTAELAHPNDDPFYLGRLDSSVRSPKHTHMCTGPNCTVCLFRRQENSDEPKNRETH